MSLKAPPTSSSFFDLYEQLGIWPSPDKEKALEIPEQAAEAEAKPVQAEISASPSARFSTSSWEAAISAFPMVDELRLDFGGPSVVDADIMQTLQHSPILDDSASDVQTDAADTSSGTAVRQSTGSHATSSEAYPSAAQSAGASAFVQSSHSRASRNPSGSGGSSRNSSRQRRLNVGHKKEQPAGWSGRLSRSSSGIDSDDNIGDDVPLSRLHPQAVEAQRHARRQKRRARRADPKILGRNPGAESGWDGEGGVPPDALVPRLEQLISNGSTGRASPSVPDEQRASSDPRINTRPTNRPTQRSVTEPTPWHPSPAAQYAQLNVTTTRPSLSIRRLEHSYVLADSASDCIKWQPLSFPRH